MRLTVHRRTVRIARMIKIDSNFWRAPFSEVADAVIAQCKTAGVALNQVLQEAGVSISTWRRWKNGTVAASFDKFAAIVEALDNHR